MVFPWAILLKEKLKCCKYRTCCESLLDNLKKRSSQAELLSLYLLKQDCDLHLSIYIMFQIFQMHLVYLCISKSIL